MSGITLSTRPKAPVIFNSDRFEGLSAYEVAVANGFEGTVEEWLLSLVGSQDLSSYIQSDTSIKHIVALTQEAYDAIVEKDQQTVYLIKQA